MNIESNIKDFFASNNRSMMGGWVIAGLKAAIAEAEKLEGKAREAALKEIQERVRREGLSEVKDVN